MSPTGMVVPPAPCTMSTGPGIAPPAIVPLGIPGRHAAWYGQSGYPTLLAGQRSTATVAFYNSGSIGWVRGRMGEVAYLGTWFPSPGRIARRLSAVLVSLARRTPAGRDTTASPSTRPTTSVQARSP